MMLFLLACGSSEPLQLPTPPPKPPPSMAMAAPDEVTVVGTASEINAATRTWLVAGDGQRTTIVLAENGVLFINGRAATVADLIKDMTVTVTGKIVGDVIVAQRAEVGADLVTRDPLKPLDPPAPESVPVEGALPVADPKAEAPATTPTQPPEVTPPPTDAAAGGTVPKP